MQTEKSLAQTVSDGDSETRISPPRMDGCSPMVGYNAVLKIRLESNVI